MSDDPVNYRVLGLMSGTSLDGADIAACLFEEGPGGWKYVVTAARTYPYSREWRDRLTRLPSENALSFCRAHIDFGHLLGQLIRNFLEETGFKPDLIASHGHTIFHRPEKGMTVQLGAGSAIAAETGLEVACDFRTTDLAQGGQGAPLVPVGDKLLFSGYDACLNLGGFGNISYDEGERRIAFDISPVNMILNALAEREGHAFDDRGAMAASGSIITGLLDAWNGLSYYSMPYPKSLGREWFEDEFLPLISRFPSYPADLSRSACEHIAIQVNRSLPGKTRMKVLVTGGGAHNDFLVGCLRRLSPHEFVIPDDLTVDYKEAIIFAFLGLLRKLGKVNILSSVTGGKRDICSGAIYRF